MNEALLTAWRIWDFIYYYCTRLVYVDKKNDNIFRVVVKKYWGEPLKAGDEVVIKPGDYYVKLHIHNCQLAMHLFGVKDEMGLGLRALKEIRKSLPALAQYVAELPHEQEIKGVVGTTILHRGARPLGFHVQDIALPLLRWYKTAFFKVILVLCHPEGLKRLRHKGDQLVAKRVFMSKTELLNRYLVKGNE